MSGSVVLVHGTGVRFASFKPNVDLVEHQLKAAGINLPLVACAWGDPLGIIFEGKSLPDPPNGPTAEKEAQELARWSWLLDDPLAELEMLSIRATPSAMPQPGQRPEWEARLESIRRYQPSDSLQKLLVRADIAGEWDPAFTQVVTDSLAETAFQNSAEVNELADAGIALARAVVAQLQIASLETDTNCVFSSQLRARIHEQLVRDWGFDVYGVGTLLAGFFQRIGTKALRRRRDTFNAAIAPPIGDILLYQSRGQEIRDFIRATIESAPKPTVVIAHSLGGIACVDLLAMENAPKVDALITVGSQAPYFYEIDALTAFKKPHLLPDGFPRWLNLYDRNDFLSFVGHRLFYDQIEDFEIDSGLPFPQSHGAYFGSDAVWKKVKGFLGI
ncbi:alpha/beta fold hydrolase [Rhizobium ruizarguesonis]|uniref:alpha/beta fold hydrolase n=1 Tax=Rhizobium ruizarguesonis TaxID=2081791 RepID=UPI001030C0ED|nr:alpha/beta fold hydrolase [Rhizobium ruizarguesonis]TBA29363.1 alpha/beta fold hydrolase [Rhizobium ruizarguesonis]TBA30327.1 alpha/beta fold hydrolase [Rhizobium ruizarguesonis]